MKLIYGDDELKTAGEWRHSTFSLYIAEVRPKKNVKLVLTLEFVPTFRIISFMAKSKLICLAPFQTFFLMMTMKWMKTEA